MGNECSVPSATPQKWRVTRKSDGAFLGIVTHRLWIDAREEACVKFQLEPFELEVEAVNEGATA